MNNKKFCCEKVKILSSSNNSPLSLGMYDEGPFFFGYSLEYIRVRYCPCCGTYLGAYPEPIKYKPDDRGLCCRIMASDVMDPDEDDTEIFYQPFTRRYFFAPSRSCRLNDPDDTAYQEWDFEFCIYCGRKQPEPLLDIWLEIIKTEFGVERQAILENMLPMLPEEYQTDWWWKKRGL